MLALWRELGEVFIHFSEEFRMSSGDGISGCDRQYEVSKLNKIFKLIEEVIRGRQVALANSKRGKL